MKQTITIDVPEGFEAKYNPDDNKIELVKKVIKPRTWEEFCNNYPVKKGEAFINSFNEAIIVVTTNWDHCRTKDVCTSKEEAEAFLALMQLRQLRKAWVEDWEPDWKRGPRTVAIVIYKGEAQVSNSTYCNCALSFPTIKMAEEFLDCFKSLIYEAKVLI